MFDPSSFISPYSPTDRVLRILDTVGNVINTISVCKYQKSSVIDIHLNVYMNGNNISYVYDFDDNDSALTAIDNLRIAIDALKINCSPTVTVMEPASVVSINYSTYKTAAAGNTLIALQWYDINDVAGVFGTAGTIYRAQALTSDDGTIRGKVFNAEIYVTFDVTNNRIIDYENALNHNRIINLGTLNLTNSTYCVASNNSNITAIDSFNIYADETSDISANNCSSIKLMNNSTVNIIDSNDVTIDNFSQVGTISGLSFVVVDKNTSMGKNCNNTIVNAATVTLRAYYDCINQEFKYTTNNNTASITLSRSLIGVRAIFRLKYTGTGTNNVVKIYDTAATLLASIFDNEKNNTFEFEFNESTGFFVFVGMLKVRVTDSKVVQVVGPTLGQTNFSLGTPVTQPLNMEMFINGIKQTYGIDFYYDSGLGQAVYINSSFPLDPSEVVEFVVY